MVQQAAGRRHIALVGAECEENLALRYIWGALAAAGHGVQLIPFNAAAETDSVAAELAASGADVAGFSMVFTYRATEFAALANRARALGFRGGLVAGGHFAAFNAEALLRDVPAIDAVAIGEGEQLMTTLAANWPDLDSVPGLVWRDAAGKMVRNQPAAKPSCLDDLALPVRLDPADEFLGLPIANVLSSRGCSHGCHFCSISAWHRLCGGPRVRWRETAAVADELAALHRGGYRLFNFHDDNFLSRGAHQNRARVAALGDGLRCRGVTGIGVAIKSRPDSVEPELFAQLKELGLFRVFLGIEAGTEPALRQLGRTQSLAENERALATLNGLDLHVCYNLLLFNPDSTLPDVRANIAFLQRHAGNPLNFCRTEVYAGTPLADRLRRDGRLLGDYWGYGYRIADPAAQRAFELMHALLFDRHHAADNLHHLAMRVDYERQLLAQFFGCPESLCARAKNFVVRVNRRSADFLLAIADLAEASAPRQPDIEDLRHAATADTALLTHEGSRVLAEIHAQAALARRRVLPDNARTAAAVSLAASLVLAAGVTRASGQMTEMVPVPPATNATSTAQEPPAGDAELMKPFVPRITRVLVRYLPEPVPVEVELLIGEDGRPTQAQVHKFPRVQAKPLTDADKQAIGKLLARLGAETHQQREQATAALKKYGPAVAPLLRELLVKTNDPEIRARASEVIEAVSNELQITDPEEMISRLKRLRFNLASLRGKRFVVPISKAELQAAHNGEFPGGHIAEMAPAPRD